MLQTIYFEKLAFKYLTANYASLLVDELTFEVPEDDQTINLSPNIGEPTDDFFQRVADRINEVFVNLKYIDSGYVFIKFLPAVIDGSDTIVSVDVDNSGLTLNTCLLSLIRTTGNNFSNLFRVDFSCGRDVPSSFVDQQTRIINGN